MTNQELSRLYWLNKDIQEDQRRLRELESAAEGGTAKISGMPHGAGVGNLVEQYAPQIAELKELISLKVQQTWYELNRLNRYIQGVDDPRMRHIMALRHIDGKTWRQIANSIDGRPDTEEAVKKSYYRFLEKSESCPECPDVR